MPLLGKTSFALAPVPVVDSVKSPVWQIACTGEIFKDYAEYATRVQMYKHKRWTCELSGKTNLTYAEALASEKQERLANQDKFPAVWKRLALNIIHYNPSDLTLLADVLANYFQSHIVIGELVVLSSTGTVARVAAAVANQDSLLSHDDRQSDPRLSIKIRDFDVDSNAPTGSEFPPSPVLSRHTLAPHSASLSPVHAPSTVIRLKPPVAVPVDDNTTLWGKQGEAFPISTYRFNLHVLSSLDDSIVHESLVMSADGFTRDKLFFQKSNFKRFIKEHTIGEMFPGAPFVVKPQFASVFELDSKPSLEMRTLMEKARQARAADAPRSGSGTPNPSTPASSDAKSRKRAARVRFPMEDTDLPTYAPRKNSPIYPSLTHAFPNAPHLDASHIQPLLQTYAFFTALSTPMHLSAFTLDDYIAALGTCAPGSALLNEVFGTCVWHATRLATRVVAIPDADVYAGLSGFERVCIEQWFKWFPGRWATGYEGLSKPDGPPRFTRMKAWQVALVGLIRDVEEGIPGCEGVLDILLAPDDGDVVMEEAMDVEGDLFTGSDLSDVEELEKRVENGTVKQEAKEGLANDILDRLVARTRRNFLRTSVSQRLALLCHFVENVLLQTNQFAAHIEKCIDECAKTKLELREVIRERRLTETKKEELVKARKLEEAEADESREIVEAMDRDEGSGDAAVNGSEDDSGSMDTSSLRGTSSRRSSNRVEHLIKKDQEKKQEEALAHQAFISSKKGKKALKARMDEMRKIEELERTLAKREHNLHQTFWRKSASINTNHIGEDRNYTKYYWFDAGAGAVSIMGGGFQEVMNSYKAKQKSPSGLEWATGRLFVATPTNGTIDDGNLTFKWGYLEDPGKIQKLRAWLDHRGIRESKLIKSLDRILEPMLAGMEKRKQDLEEQTPIYAISKRGNFGKKEPPREYIGHKQYINTLAQR
ncbi:MAG: hypothetical protein SGCHY_000440 [Lobulomycetales sp.]